MSDICLITGDHPRHKYFAQKLIATGKVCSWVMEKREEFVPQPPTDLSDSLKALFDHHFNERDRIESLVFGKFAEIPEDSVPIFNVDMENLNDTKTIEFVKKFNPKLVVSYGCHKLSSNFIETAGACFWNTHGGLSTEYRGVTTHFWPSYFLEPQMTGITLHETTNLLDGGAIIFQTAAPMVKGDSLHRLAARNVEVFSEELASRIMSLDFLNLPKGKKQTGYGKVFMSKDWRPEHLHLIYDVYEDRIVDAVLREEIKGRLPNLISVL